MKKLVRKLAGSLGYDIVRISSPTSHLFTIGDVKYVADPCSVGQTPQGERTALGAIRMIGERQLKQLRILDICCGVGIIGLTMYSTLRKTSAITGAAFADINVFNLNSLHKTLGANNLGKLVGDEIHVWLSDGLSHIPEGERFDIIVSNPPHFFSKAFSEQDLPLSPHVLGTFDAGWDFHKAFYSKCQDYLTESGEIWFLENGEGARDSDLLPFINANNALQYVKTIDEPLLPGFFWMITKRA